MTVNGFRPEDSRARIALNPAVARRFFRVTEQLARLLRVEVEGMANLPASRALLVANHAFGWDMVFVMSRVWQQSHRPLWALGEHAWWRVPFLRRFAAAVGVVDGTQENLDQLLRNEELVLVLPGGLREALKPRELRYRLLWGHRYGFVRAAIRNRTPVVPLVSMGADDLFDLVGNAFQRGERLFGRPGIPIPLPSRILPIPHLVPLRFVIGEPLLPPAGSERDTPLVRRFRREIEGTLHEMIEFELGGRAGIDLT